MMRWQTYLQRLNSLDASIEDPEQHLEKPWVEVVSRSAAVIQPKDGDETVRKPLRAQQVWCT